MLLDYARTPLFIFILIKIASSKIGSKEENLNLIANVDWWHRK